MKSNDNLANHKFIQIIGLIVFVLIQIIPSGCTKPPEETATVTITSAGWSATPSDIQLMKSLITEFEKENPGIRVKHETVTGDYWSKILTQLAGGNLPDAFWSDGV